MKKLVLLGIMSVFSMMSFIQAAEEAPKPEAKTNNPIVKILTTKGEIILELDAEKAPATVENFMGYVQDGFYTDTVFHRVIKGFMVQGGGMTADLAKKPTKAPIKNEAANGLKNLRGTVAMARTNVPDSATSQFFINHKDNAFLDFRDPSPRGIGYAVFGKVVKGMEVVDAIAEVQTGTKGSYRDVPTEPVTIQSVTVIGGKACDKACDKCPKKDTCTKACSQKESCCKDGKCTKENCECCKDGKCCGKDCQCCKAACNKCSKKDSCCKDGKCTKENCTCCKDGKCCGKDCQCCKAAESKDCSKTGCQCSKKKES